MLPEPNAHPKTPVYHTTNDVVGVTSDDDESHDPHAAAGDIVRAAAADCHRHAPAARHPPRSHAHTAATAIAAGSNLSLCSDFNPSVQGYIDAGRGDGVRGRHGAPLFQAVCWLNFAFRSCCCVFVWDADCIA